MKASSKPTPPPGAGRRDPRAASFISRLFFIFVDPLVSVGYARILEQDDLLELDAVRTEPLHKAFDVAWSAQLKKPQPNIKRAVFAGSLHAVIFSGILYGISAATSLAGPLLLNRIVGGLSCYAAGGGSACEPSSQLY
jgi:ATP-binding cassette subfamily C (CFTR/MRP) protein 1